MSSNLDGSEVRYLPSDRLLEAARQFVEIIYHIKTTFTQILMILEALLGVVVIFGSAVVSFFGVICRCCILPSFGVSLVGFAPLLSNATVCY